MLFKGYSDLGAVMTYVIFIMTYVILIYFSTTIQADGGSLLIIPCETASKSVIPAIKAIMAEELLEKHGLSQNQVAEILGISQSAVSKYSSKARGHIIKIDDVEEIQPQINRMIILLVSRKGRRSEFLHLFCQTCRVIRRKGLMCQFCGKTEPKILAEDCGFCLSDHQNRDGV